MGDGRGLVRDGVVGTQTDMDIVRLTAGACIRRRIFEALPPRHCFANNKTEKKPARHVWKTQSEQPPLPYVLYVVTPVTTPFRSLPVRLPAFLPPFKVVKQ